MFEEEDWDAGFTSPSVAADIKPVISYKPAEYDYKPANVGFGRGSMLMGSDRNNNRFDADKSRDGYSSNRNNYSENRSYELQNNYPESRGNYSESRGNYSESRGNYSESRGNHSESRGGYSESRGKFSDRDRPRGGRQYEDENTTTDYISIYKKSIPSVIGKGGATINQIRDSCGVKIDIPPREEVQYSDNVKIKVIGKSQENIDKAKDMIRNATERSYGQPRNDNFGSRRDRSGSIKRQRDEIRDQSEHKRPSSPLRSSHASNPAPAPVSEPSTGFIDWDKVRAAPIQNLNKFKDHPAVVKDFYTEHPDIMAMTREEVKQFRIDNFNIMVELFKKEKLTYSIDAKEEVDPRTPEEIEDYLFATIPKPVKKIEHCFERFPEIMAECQRQNFINPTPIQAQLWPILLKGGDCVGIAQTGTGKTLAFLLPALIHIDNQITPRDQRLGPNVLVLSPTRELAIQIEQEVKKINYKGIRSLCVYGGGDKKEQIASCERGVEIIIATPGRLYDLIQVGCLNVTSVTYLVLDEADRMLDLGFEPQIMKILLDIRPDRQTVMTSATWPEGVRRLATKYLNEPIQLYVGSLDLSAAKTVTQELVMIKRDEDKQQYLMDYIENRMTPEDKLIVFVGRKSMADNLSCDLSMKKMQVQSIHGDREQIDREEALQDFKEGHVRILIATDVASRGIDVKDITCVINFDFPRNIEDYVHRVGRTGRAGHTGTAITFMAREDWKHAKELIQILKKGEQEIPEDLVKMAERYEEMLKKRELEGGSRGGGGGFRGNRDGGFGGGFGGGGHRDGGFGGGNREGGFRGNSDRSNQGARVFEPRGRRSDRGRDKDDTGGFVFC